MGKGSESTASWTEKQGVLSTLHRSSSQTFQGMVEDLSCLQAMWLKGPQQKHEDHKQRLDAFYEKQAHAYDRFREQFLWGRKLLLAACAKRLEHKTQGMIWVDIGGGTGENVLYMSQYMDLERFKAIYIVDLCEPLCKVATKKIEEQGWTNVHVVQHDACKFDLEEGSADLITFSYSLSMIPAFHEAVDRSLAYLAEEGLFGIADFFVSSKYDNPCRQMNWGSRWFWRSIFDMDNIDIGPERRQYVETRLRRAYEYNGFGTIPYVPKTMKAPYFVWIGTKIAADSVELEAPKPKPVAFPPTFIYSVSWEDPQADRPILNVGPGDVVLTFTSGGCNSLHMLAQGAEKVYSVDINPAQSALLELKCLAIQHLPYQDVWMMFGEGRHGNFKNLFEKTLAPFMTQTTYDFWKKRMHYFQDGFYYHGSMGKVILMLYWVQCLLGMRHSVLRLCSAQTLQEQKEEFDAMLVVWLLKRCPKCLRILLHLFFSWAVFNPVICWLGLGVPKSQLSLIEHDKRTTTEYACTSANGVIEHSLISRDNYFYLVCLLGHFTPECCPEFLKEDTFHQLKADGIDRIHIKTSSFLEQLCKRKYTKVILMDHVDWAWQTSYVEELALALEKHVVSGGCIIFRSASIDPPYADVFRAHGFDIRCVSRITDEAHCGFIDRVNMYSSFWVGHRR